MLQPRQAPKPGFDPVERRQDVEARNRDIAWPKTRRRGGVREPRSTPKARKGRSKIAIRLRRLAEDDDRTAPIAGRGNHAGTPSRSSIITSASATVMRRVQQPRVRPA